METLELMIENLKKFRKQELDCARKVYNSKFEIVNFRANIDCKRWFVIQEIQKQRIIKYIETL